MARILVIDDEESIRKSLRRALELEGYEVMEARDGEEGEQLFRKNPTDLIITDIIMPKQGGLDLLNKLKIDFPDLKCIVFSGGDRMAKGDDIQFLLDIALSEGASRTFTKPFDLNEILESAKELIGIEQKERH